ncbi:MAG: hypothetical protein OZ921_03315 [Sorangiineae bacterium]|nr:hypothetical protein [Polyangiaceae bacterium]MEB2321518.1 hypothetical protein [Sorangiineae bacterium]
MLSPANRAVARRRSRLVVGAAALLTVSACKKPSGADGGGPAPRGSAPSQPPPSARAPTEAPLTGETVDIPGGSFQAGSVPGSEGRKPGVEPRLYAVELGPYQIDRLPYPNDPSKPPVVGVGRGEAERLCATAGGRLCTELEWERACKGPSSDRFPGGGAWDARCASRPESCASGFDVVAMGTLREWTASDVAPTDGEGRGGGAVRGAPAGAPAPDHRCAARAALDPSTTADDLGFRCCKGAPNAAVVKEPKLGEVFARARVNAERLQALLASDPATQAIAKDIKLFREPDAANTVVSRGPGDRKGFDFTVAPLLWQPAAGSEYLVAVGRSGDTTSFVVVYHVTGADEYRLDSSFIMKSEPGPIALAYSASIRPRLHFSTCWGCPGETGKILFRPPDDAVILQP